jgi:hypothetical protein
VSLNQLSEKYDDGGEVSVEDLIARLESATPLERQTYETLGMEPGLDRATFLPIAGSRIGGDLQMAVPQFIYDIGKAFVTPGAAMQGVPLSYEDVVNMAGNTMGGGLAISSPVEGAVAGMAVKPRGGAVKAARTVGKASKAAKVAEEIPETARQMLDQAAPARAVQTDTPKFKNWFGNSQLLDESGKPKVFYHITAKDFDTFKPGGFDPELSGPAMWFGDDPAALPAAHNVRKDTEGANVMPVYLRMQRPLVMDDQASKEWARSAFADDWREFPLLVTDKIVKDIKDEGYDGIIFRHGDGNTEYITFDPTQIKSAIGNDGNFDLTNPVITKAQGGTVRAYDPQQIENIMSSINAPRNYASGGSVWAYDPGRVDAILNQFRGAV